MAVNQEYHTYIDYLIILKIILINDNADLRVPLTCIPNILGIWWSQATGHGGGLFEKGAYFYLILWPRGWVLIWGRVLIQGNTVC